MVENTIENKPENKKGPALPRMLIFIAVGVFISLIFSVYWRISHIGNFLGNSSVIIPEINEVGSGMEGLQDIVRQAQGQSANDTANPYKNYTTPDGYLSIRYPSSFADGKSKIEEALGQKLESNDFLLYAYKIDTTFTDANPTTLTIAHYDATSTEDVIVQIKKSLDQQQCQSDIKEAETTNDNTASQLFDSTYRCGDQGELSLWQARIAIVRKNDAEFYTVTGATASKNWESAKLDINSILSSISLNQPMPAETIGEPEDINENNQPQNNEATK